MVPGPGSSMPPLYPLLGTECRPGAHSKCVLYYWATCSPQLGALDGTGLGAFPNLPEVPSHLPLRLTSWKSSCPQRYCSWIPTVITPALCTSGTRVRPRADDFHDERAGEDGPHPRGLWWWWWCFSFLAGLQMTKNIYQVWAFSA